MKFKKIGLTIMLSFTTSLLTVGCTNENEISHETVDQVKVDDIKEPIQEKFNQGSSSQRYYSSRTTC